MADPKVSISKGILTISVSLKDALETRRESESGMSLLLCTMSQVVDTEEQDASGKVLVPGIGNVRVNLNVFQKNPAYNAAVSKALQTLKDEEAATAAAAAMDKARQIAAAKSGGLTVTKH